ncbi:AAA family ATPase [Mycolicibacterium mageritense]|nr:MAG: hypothetical protein E6Q55_14385 [Mycolicibacterium mageritense]
MSDMPHAADAVQKPWAIAGNLDAQVHETHTGIVFLLGDNAYKAKKSVLTDFLDFTTSAQREKACEREVALNRRLAPESYLGVGHFIGPHGGTAEPVVVMCRYPDSMRLASMVSRGVVVDEHLDAIAEKLATFHLAAARGAIVAAEGSADAVLARWESNLAELQRFSDVVGEYVDELRCLAERFVAGRVDLFEERVSNGRIVDGHADLLADDIFCAPEGPAILDCLEFDDRLRYVDGIDDAAFLAMDLEFAGRPDLGSLFLDRYRDYAQDPAPVSLIDFYIAYRAGVRAKVDCVRVTQGHPDAAIAARRHAEIALDHLRSGTVQLIIVGGGPGTGKTTISRALAEQLEAQVISTDDVRREMHRAGTLKGEPGTVDAGLYAPEQVSAVYDEVLRRARVQLGAGRSVILDGTWRDPHQRDRAHAVAADAAAPIVEFTCSLPQDAAAARIRSRTASTSDATPEIAAALDVPDVSWPGSHRIDTSQPLDHSVAEAQRICLAI